MQVLLLQTLLKAINRICEGLIFEVLTVLQLKFLSFLTI